MSVVRKPILKFVVTRQCIRVQKRTRFAPFCMQKVPKRYKSLPNIAFGALEAIGYVRAKKSSDVGRAKQCIRVPKRPFASIFVQWVSKCSKTLPNIV